MALISIDPKNCTNCLACVRACPVHAIQTSVGNDIPTVVDARCIGCGSCLGACRYDAISYWDSTGEVKELMKSEENVAAIVDPSISGEFPDITDYRKFVEMIRSLGFKYVNEVSFGVDLVAKAYKMLFDEKKREILHYRQLPCYCLLYRKIFSLADRKYSSYYYPCNGHCKCCERNLR